MDPRGQTKRKCKYGSYLDREEGTGLIIEIDSNAPNIENNNGKYYISFGTLQNMSVVNAQNICEDSITRKQVFK